MELTSLNIFCSGPCQGVIYVMKFSQNPTVGSCEEFDFVKLLTDDRQGTADDNPSYKLIWPLASTVKTMFLNISS